MNRLFTHATATLLFAATIIQPLIAKENEPPEISMEGLKLVEKDRRGEIYVDPDVDWSVFTEIELQDATVAFRRNWQRDQNRYDPWKIRNDDVQRIKNSLAELFHEVFAEELSGNGGYVMADGASVNVMTIKPAIVDLDIYAPDTMRVGRSKTFTESAGRMTLQLEVYDSVTGDLMAKASDRREAPRRGMAQWATSVSNRAEAQRMLQTWAIGLRERLDKARLSVPAAESASD